MLEQLLALWEEASEAWVETKNDLKDAKKAHDESIATKNKIENLILVEMLENGKERVALNDKVFTPSFKNVNTINKDLALQLIKEKGLGDALLRDHLKLNWLKLGRLDEVEGVVVTERHPTLDVDTL